MLTGQHVFKTCSTLGENHSVHTFIGYHMVLLGTSLTGK